MACNLEGTYFENCNCDSVCPCATSGFAQAGDHDRCLVTFAFHIDTGSIDGVSLDDRNAILIVDTPGQMTDGDWQVGLIIDDRASDEQAEGIGKILGGQVGGPIGSLAPLVGGMLGMERAPIEYSNDGRIHSVKAGNVVDIEIEDVQHAEDGPVAKVSGLTGHPVAAELTIARANRATISVFGREWDNAGKNGNSAPFSWSA